MDVDKPTPSSPPPAGESVYVTPLLTIHEPRVVIGDRGAGWLMAGWDNFRAAPGQWLALCIVGTILLVIINAIPFANFVNGLLQQVWVAGVLLGCHAQFNGEAIRVRHLFAGFGPKALPLILSGALVGLAGLLMAAAVFGPLLADMITTPDPQDFLLQQDMQALLLRVLVLMALMLPLYAALWFAPALIVFVNLDVKQALKLSLVGCLKNAWPFLIYGLCALVLCLLVLLTLGLALLVVVPMFYSSIYVSFREIYVD